MLLAVDIGNTSITLGLFDEEALIEELRLASDVTLSQEEYEVLIKTILKTYKITDVIISSVVDELTLKFSNALKCALGVEPLILSNKTEIGVPIRIDVPDELGADRIANAAGACVLYKLPVIVVDFGTATTFDIINSNGEFIGGLIAPGINLQLNSLSNFTSKLPKIEAAESPKAIATNTEDAILSGVIRGCAGMIDGMIEQSEAELGSKATIVATGGYASVVAKYLKRPFDFINPTLTLEGLRHLYNLNKRVICQK